MKKIEALFLLACIILFFSCQLPNEKPGDFKLLHLPDLFEIKGTSNLKYDDIRNYYILPKTKLPVFGDLLKNIKAAEEQSDAQIIFSVDKSLDIKAEDVVTTISDLMNNGYVPMVW